MPGTARPLAPLRPEKGKLMLILERIKQSGQLPNILSGIRLALFWIPSALIAAEPHNTPLRWWAVAAFAGIVLTDKLDGYLARRWQQITKLGQVLDPLADKLLVVALVATLCATDILASPWGWIFFAVILALELGTALIRWLDRRGHISLVVPSNDDGKMKMFLQSTGVGIALFPVWVWWWPLIIWTLLVTSLLFSLRSGIAYLRAN